MMYVDGFITGGRTPKCPLRQARQADAGETYMTQNSLSQSLSRGIQTHKLSAKILASLSVLPLAYRGGCGRSKFVAGRP